MVNVVSHIVCELLSSFFMGKREDLAGVVFEDLGEVSLYDPLIAEISCVLYVCMCGYSYSLSRVCVKRERV